MSSSQAIAPYYLAISAHMSTITVACRLIFSSRCGVAGVVCGVYSVIYNWILTSCHPTKVTPGQVFTLIMTDDLHACSLVRDKAIFLAMCGTLVTLVCVLFFSSFFPFLKSPVSQLLSPLVVCHSTFSVVFPASTSWSS